MINIKKHRRGNSSLLKEGEGGEGGEKRRGGRGGEGRGEEGKNHMGALGKVIAKDSHPFGGPNKDIISQMTDNSVSFSLFMYNCMVS